MTAKTPVKATKPAKPAKAKSTVKKAKTSKKAAKTASSKAAPSAAAKSAAAKHEAHVKHLEHVAHMAHIGQPVSLAIGDALPVCALEAVAMSLRLAGARVHDDDVGELWSLLGEPDAAPVGAALAAAALFGLAGMKPVSAAAAPVTLLALDGLALGRSCLVLDRALSVRDPKALGRDGERRAHPAASLILSIDQPGPHAVLATPAGWWSWGELYDPWPCRVTGAWAVGWS
ncbi:MAG: hypothetical protein ACRDVE_02540 [Actinocrinis sp.]